jgi:hypothetical protein
MSDDTSAHAENREKIVQSSEQCRRPASDF